MAKNNIITFRSLTYRPEIEDKISSGNKMYTYTYFDEETGKEETKTINVYEQIQSYKQELDIKTKIELEKGESNGKGLYVDVSKLGDNFDSIDAYVSEVAERFKESLRKGEHSREETGEVAKESTESGREDSGESAENTK